MLRKLGAAYHGVNRYDDASTAFQRALEIKPDPAVYTNLGTLFFYRGLYDQAIVAFDRAVQMRPNDFRMWSNLADAYRLTPGRSSDAAQAYTRGLQLLDEQLAKSPDSVDLATRRVIMLAKNGTCTGSGEAIATLDLSRASFTELYRVAVAREVCKDRVRALELLTKSIEGGYSLDQVNQDPELIRLREDVRFHRFLSARSAGSKQPVTDKE